ncbi:hypothetical protein KB206_17445 [Microvirga sp. STS02]|uniref:hypothetical protein n=1 Tax=Hymenobacter negativus TaxID=2795026 RepID=UPI0018DC91CD|nr:MULTISPECIES: hypothetical protein [Bacteria]MBH8570681.1 hypothetical protein [Hymenobacter negativus]MBR7210419.1 hypothetical protein [Microvirga sp. STS02]
MNTSVQTSSRLSRVVAILAATIGALLLDGFLVAWIWADGVDFATMDRVMPGESGFHIDPLPLSYKLLLGLLLLINFGLLYLLSKRSRQYAWGFAAGAIVPMGYLLFILASA